MAALHARKDLAAARFGSEAERDPGQPANLVYHPSFIAAARLETVGRECIANVSHELRTPLTVLLGFIETVRDLRLDPISTLEAASKPPTDERMDVRVLLARIRTDAEGLSAGRHRIELDVDDGFDLLGAEREIASAFGNLAGNAVRYTPPGGVVRLVWRASAKGAAFSVEDTGIGIETRHIPRLTERFYRVDRDRSHQSGGTGLGLAIVKRALSRHQATLEIESKPGRGSRFTARFSAHRVVPVTT